MKITPSRRVGGAIHCDGHRLRYVRGDVFLRERRWNGPPQKWNDPLEAT